MSGREVYGCAIASWWVSKAYPATRHRSPILQLPITTLPPPSHDHPISILSLHLLPLPSLPPPSKRPHRRPVPRALPPKLPIIEMTYIHRGEEGHEDGHLQGCACEATAWLRDSMSARVIRATESSEKQKMCGLRVSSVGRPTRNWAARRQARRLSRSLGGIVVVVVVRLDDDLLFVSLLVAAEMVLCLCEVAGNRKSCRVRSILRKAKGSRLPFHFSSTISFRHLHCHWCITWAVTAAVRTILRHQVHRDSIMIDYTARCGKTTSQTPSWSLGFRQHLRQGPGSKGPARQLLHPRSV